MEIEETEMLRPGEQFTYQGELYIVFEVSEEFPTGKACRECEKEYGEHGKPCSWYDSFPCTTYCGMKCYPKLVTLCINQER